MGVETIIRALEEMTPNPVSTIMGEPFARVNGWVRGNPCQIGLKFCHFTPNKQDYWLFYAYVNGEVGYESDRIGNQIELNDELTNVSEAYSLRRATDKQGRLF